MKKRKMFRRAGRKLLAASKIQGRKIKRKSKKVAAASKKEWKGVIQRFKNLKSLKLKKEQLVKIDEYAKVREAVAKRSTIAKGGGTDLLAKCSAYTAAKEVMAAGLYPYFRVLSSQPDTEVIIEGVKTIMIGSNNYLGLTSHPKVKEAAIKAVEKYGTSCTGSRFLNGTLDLHVKLEERLAKFMGKDACLVYSTGFQTNLGTISTLVGKSDVAIIDKDDHASIVDGCRLAFGKTFKFRHNDMDDLERVLGNMTNRGGKLIIVDGVYSMGGDVCNLPEVVRLAKAYNAKVMVDDAHSIGVLGKNGRGTASHFGLENEVDLIMGTFSKSFASLGGFVVASADVIHYLKHVSRELIFSASMPPSTVAACLAALDIMETEPERIERLWKIRNKMFEGYKKLGFKLGNSKSPIIPVIVGDDILCFKMGRRLAEEGVYVNPIVFPAVPPGNALLRTSYTATHTEEEMDLVLERFKKVGKELGII